jgi:hypothetical protein
MDSLNPVDSVGHAPRPQAFTVLIPRALQPTVDALSGEVRQRVLAELFRLAAHTSRERAGIAKSFTYARQLEVAGCMVCVEMDDSRSRLMLTGLTPPLHS